MDEFINKLLKQMTLEEKIGQLNLVSYNENTEEEVRAGRAGAVINAHDAGDIRRLREEAAASRLGIPLLIGADVIHGYKTIFPVPLAAACSFNPELIAVASHLSTKEAADVGINWIYAPILDLCVDPRWGRINESAGEDPHLIGVLGAARIRGIQKDGNAVACAKHFIGYGRIEAGLDYALTDFSNHTMEVYFIPPYREAIKAGALCMMCAFTAYDGVPLTANSYILNDVLRGTLCFTGVVTSDWDSIAHLLNYKAAQDGPEAAAVALKSGVDIDMHSRIYERYLAKAAEHEPTLKELIHKAAGRVLLLKKRLGLFADRPSLPRADARTCEEAAERLARESIALLKNENNILPLSRDTSLLVVGGIIDDNDIHLGAWSALGAREQTIGIRAGITEIFPRSEFFPVAADGVPSDFAGLGAAAKAAETVLLCLGEPRRLSGENSSRADISLPEYEEKIVRFFTKNNIPFIAFITAGRPLVITEVAKNARALLWSFHLGHKAGIALASILSGAENPGARLAVTFPRSLGQIPLYYNRLPTGRPDLIRYVDEDIKPLYPFGYGLSYSVFSYDEPSSTYDKEAHALTVTGLVRNLSDRSGSEVVQVYLIALRTNKLYPVKSLIGFKKVLIAAGHAVGYEIRCPLPEIHIEEADIMVGSCSETGLFIKNVLK